MEAALLDAASQGEINHDHNGWLTDLDKRVDDVQNGSDVATPATVALVVVVVGFIVGAVLSEHHTFGETIAIAMATGSFFGLTSFLALLALHKK